MYTMALKYYSKLQLRAMVVVAVMLAAAVTAPAPGPPSVQITCERLESVARSCTRYLKSTLLYLNDECCSGVEEVYEALTNDGENGTDIGFVCRCLKSYVVTEGLRPYLYRILNLPRLCGFKDLGSIPFNSSTVENCRFTNTPPHPSP